MFGNLSFWEIALIFLAILLLFGAKRIPEIAGSMGKGIKEFKRSLTDVERSISEPDRPAGRLPADQPPAAYRADQPRDAVTPRNDDDQPEPRRLLI